MEIALSHDLARVYVVLVTLLTVGACVALHYEGLSALSRRRQRRSELQRRHVLSGFFVMVGLHVAEIWIFGVGYTLVELVPGAGDLEWMSSTVSAAALSVGWLDRIYFSASAFTTLGFGDLVPTGALRFLAGTEALVGLMLITWSASFTFLQMERFWRVES